MERVSRSLLLTVALSAAGAVCGALAAVVGLAILVVSRDAFSPTGLTFSRDMLVVAAGEGAAYGLVLGPTTAWLALRRVPLGRAMLITTVGTAVGALIASPLQGGSYLGALAGFLVAAFWLRRRASVPRLADSSRVA